MRSARSAPSWAPSVALAAALAVAYLALAPATGDHAAAEYRATLGLVAWDGGWYGGHHVPGYSLLLPLLAAPLGARLVFFLSVWGNGPIP